MTYNDTLPVQPGTPGAGVRLRRLSASRMSTSGSAELSQLSSFWFDITFAGISGLMAEGIYDYAFEDAELKRLYFNRSSLKVVLCDSSKFQRMSLVHFATLEPFDPGRCRCPRCQ